MRELQVDGVRVFHVEGPAKTTAVLFFGVGLRDESFATVGVTHLIEHLALSTLPRSHLAFNGSVRVDHTFFDATGRPEEVGAFLARVCTALGDLPLERLPQEAGVLLAEDCYGTDPAMAAAWTARFGLRGPGMATVAGPGPLAITGDQVSRHAARWFTTATAALAVVGPLPPDLRLPLPAGLRPDRPVPVAVPPASGGPEWVAGPCGGVGLLLDRPGPRDPAALVAQAVLVERLEDVARTQRGLSYSVEADVVDVGVDDVVTIAVDAREGRASDVAGVVWAELSDLAEHGPRPEELAHAVEGLLRIMDTTDSEVAESEAPRAAFHAVQQLRFRGADVIAQGCAATTADDVARLLTAARSSALLVVPEGHRVPASAVGITERSWCPTSAELPTGGRTFRPPALARLFSKDLRQALVVTDEALGLRDDAGATHVVAWAEVAGLVPVPDGGDGFLVVGTNGCSVLSHPDLWGRAAHDAVVAHLPEHHLDDLARARRAASDEQELAPA